MPSSALSILAILFALAPLLPGAERGSRPVFHPGKDILVAQFDAVPDADDIHSLAALGSMLVHPDFRGVRAFGVVHAYGTQKTDRIWNPQAIMERVFGPQNWTSACRKGGMAHWHRSVSQVAQTISPVLRNGGHVWVQEAGQSDFTRDWLEKLLREENDITPDTARSHIHLVQHSAWNEKHTSRDDLTYLKKHLDYIRIDDGNRANNTPGYVSPDPRFLNGVAKCPHPEQAVILWKMADELIGPWNARYSVIGRGGVDFSDCVENWWIFQLGERADTVEKFWNRYVLSPAATQPRE